MSMFRTHLNRTVLVGLLFALTCFMMPRPAEAVSNGNVENPEIRNLLRQAAQQADVLDYDADQMTMLLESDVNWQLHASELTQVRAHVNALGVTLAKLEADRNLGNVWQQRAIDTAVPMLREIANNTTDAINHLNKNQTRPVSGQYADYLEANADTAHQLAGLINATAAYGRSSARLNTLKQDIDMAQK
jgi:hypothetical protein